MTYYQEPYGHRKNKIKVELDLSNYATKSNLKEELIHQNILKKLI